MNFVSRWKSSSRSVAESVYPSNFIFQQHLRGWLHLHGCVWGSSRCPFILSPQPLKGTPYFSAHPLLGLVWSWGYWTCSQFTKVFICQGVHLVLSLLDGHHCTTPSISLWCSPLATTPGSSSCGSRSWFRSPCLPIKLLDNRMKFHRNRKDTWELGLCSFTCFYWRNKLRFGMFYNESRRAW